MDRWRRLKLDVCADARARLKNETTTPAGRELAMVRLGYTRELFMRVWLERRLTKFRTGELSPFTNQDHARIFCALTASREALELWRSRLAFLQTHPRKEVPRAS